MCKGHSKSGRRYFVNKWISSGLLKASGGPSPSIFQKPAHHSKYPGPEHHYHLVDLAIEMICHDYPQIQCTIGITVPAPQYHIAGLGWTLLWIWKISCVIQYHIRLGTIKIQSPSNKVSTYQQGKPSRI